MKNVKNLIAHSEKKSLQLVSELTKLGQEIEKFDNKWLNNPYPEVAITNHEKEWYLLANNLEGCCIEIGHALQRIKQHRRRLSDLKKARNYSPQLAE